MTRGERNGYRLSGRDSVQKILRLKGTSFRRAMLLQATISAAKKEHKE